MGVSPGMSEVNYFKKKKCVHHHEIPSYCYEKSRCKKSFRRNPLKKKTLQRRSGWQFLKYFFFSFRSFSETNVGLSLAWVDDVYLQLLPTSFHVWLTPGASFVCTLARPPGPKNGKETSACVNHMYFRSRDQAVQLLNESQFAAMHGVVFCLTPEDHSYIRSQVNTSCRRTIIFYELIRKRMDCWTVIIADFASSRKPSTWLKRSNCILFVVMHFKLFKKARATWRPWQS